MSHQLPAIKYNSLINKIFIKLLSLPDFYFKLRIYNFLKKIIGEKRLITKTKYGFLFSIDERDLIQRTILYEKSWENTLSEFFYNELNENDIFFDIGSNVGYFSCLALTKGVYKTILFEPDMINTEIAAFNIIINKFNNSNYEICNIALGDKIQSKKFYRSTVGNTGTSGFIPYYKDYVDVFDVNVDTLDNYVAKNVIPTVLKIDTEGFEYFILKGGENMLKIHRPRLIVFESNTEESFYKIKILFDELGIYDIFKIEDNHGINYIAKLISK